MYVSRRAWGEEYQQCLSRDRAVHALRWGCSSSSKPSMQALRRLASSDYWRTAARIAVDAGDPEAAAAAATIAWSSCLKMLTDSPLSKLFEAHVLKALCTDSYAFLKEAVRYAETPFDSDQAQVSWCEAQASYVHDAHGCATVIVCDTLTAVYVVGFPVVPLVVPWSSLTNTSIFVPS